jgi:HAD superfamily hydrolase (TIGR01509 family)
MNHWVVFDAMGVIFEIGNDVVELLIPYIQARNPHTSAEHIQSTYRQTSLGQITARHFWQQVGLGESYPQVEQEYLDTCLKLDPLFKETATQLSQKYSLAILSNDVKEWSLHLRQRHGLDQLCQKAVISGEVGHRKPARTIYEILLEKLASSPSECIFIDDRVPNLFTAKEVGMIPIWYQRRPEPRSIEIPYTIQSFAELPKVVNEIFT